MRQQGFDSEAPIVDLSTGRMSHHFFRWLMAQQIGRWMRAQAVQDTGSFTADPGNGPLQTRTNSGAFTLTAPTRDGEFSLLVTNASGAGTITFSGFVGGSHGASLTTTNGHKFRIDIKRWNKDTSHYYVYALQ